MKVSMKFTVFLLPYSNNLFSAHIPQYPEVITNGATVEEAFRNAKEALELHLAAENPEEDILITEADVHFPHVVIGEVDVDVPEVMVEKQASATG